MTIKTRATVYLSTDLIERVKNAVWWTPGLTVAGLAERALERAVADLEGCRKDGVPFPRRRSELKPGRPRKDANISEVAS